MLAVVTTNLDLYGVIVYKGQAGTVGIKIGKAQKFTSCSDEELRSVPSKSEARERGYLSATAP